MFIYKFTNPKNNKCYIGISSRSINKLFIRYNCEINGNGKKRKIGDALRSKGIENFKFEIIKDGIKSFDELKELEKYFIKFYDSMKHGYNMTPGGDGTKLFGEANGMYGKGYLTRGHKLSEETRKKQSAWQQNGNAYWCGKKRSKESIEKGATKIRGKNHYLFGRHLNKETKKKISETLKTWKINDIDLLISLYNKGLIYGDIALELNKLPSNKNVNRFNVGSTIKSLIENNKLVKRKRKRAKY